jgi:RNA polymerase sigma-70 factor (ECF subfamily)
MFHFSRDRFEAEDLTADTFERALKYFPKYDPNKSSFRTWLFSIAHNVGKRHARTKRRRHAEYLEGPDMASMASEGIEQMLGDVELRQSLSYALTDLPKRDYEVMALKFGGGLSNREIAKVTGISETNVGTIVGRSLRKVSEALQ